MKDPGTIYSDDEVENFSDDDDEFEKEMALQRISLKNDGGDGFFDDLPDESTKLKKTKKPVESSIDKYLKKSTNAYDINNTIERVRLEDKKYFSDEDDDDDEDDKDKDLTPNENESYTIKEAEVLKLKNNLKKKEKKKERVEKCLAEKMEKEKEEFCFEDAPTVTSDISFLEMNLSPPLLKAIANMGYETPTPIQASTIPIALKGRDICGCAATGTGKTAAFMLPIVQRLIFKPSIEEVTRVLVLVPTRELGVQVFQVTESICEFTDVTASLSVGGLNRGTQTKELMDNPDIIIATPGRLIDHLHNTPDFNLKHIEVLVLDEADRMLDKFFIEQLTEIVRQCSFTRQTMLFSATMTDKVKDLVVVSLKSPVRVFVNNNTEVAQNLRQEFIRLKVKNDENRLAVLAHLLMNNFKEETIVFVQQKYECHRMHIIFGLMGLKCGELHGNLKQQKRLEYLKKFKDKEVHILFATDVAARGLDIKGVKTVINYTVPVSYEMYVHRVGRTARAGFSGRSITISYDSGEDFTMLRKIQKNSFAPLYERIINPNHILLYVAKLKKLERSVKKVLELEVEEKMLNGSVNTVDKLKDKLTNKNPNKSKKAMKDELLSFEKIKKEKERLKKIISGPYQEEKPKKKKNGNDPIKKKKRKNKGKREVEENMQDDTGNSIFDKDLSERPKKRRK